METRGESSIAKRELDSRRVAILAGGTAGHIYPALALADAYRAARPDTRLLFIGTASGFERHLIPAHGYRLELIDGGPLFGVGLGSKVGSLTRSLRGLIQARRLLRAEGIQLAVGFGGYASAGALLAARSLRLRTVIHEGNAAPGLTNRLLAPLVDRIYLGYAEAQSVFPAGRTRVIGMPVRAPLSQIGAQRQPPHGLARPAHILVTGGSLGSGFFNRAAPELLRLVTERGIDIEVQHQTGIDTATVQAAYDGAAVRATVVSYIDDMVSAYAWADFVVTCAGGALFEVAAAAVPALVVPLAVASEDHQRANAQAFAALTGLSWVDEDTWNAQTLAEQIAALLTDMQAWRSASARMHAAARSDAGPGMVADCETLLRPAS